MRCLIRAACRRVSGVIVVSEGLRSEFEGLVPRARIYALPNGTLAPERLQAKDWSGKLEVVFLGWISYRNGTIWLGLVLHCTVAFSMDILALYNKGLLF